MGEELAEMQNRLNTYEQRERDAVRAKVTDTKAAVDAAVSSATATYISELVDAQRRAEIYEVDAAAASTAVTAIHKAELADAQRRAANWESEAMTAHARAESTLGVRETCQDSMRR